MLGMDTVLSINAIESTNIRINKFVLNNIQMKESLYRDVFQDTHVNFQINGWVLKCLITLFDERFVRKILCFLLKGYELQVIFANTMSNVMGMDGAMIQVFAWLYQLN